MDRSLENNRSLLLRAVAETAGDRTSTPTLDALRYAHEAAPGELSKLVVGDRVMVGVGFGVMPSSR
jgi:hypothetical protein